MSDDSLLGKLRDNIEEAKKTLKTRRFKKRPPSGLPGRFFSAGIELISGVLVGVGAGLFIDRAFGTSPWGLIILFIFGSAAGMLNVYKNLIADSKNKKNPNG